MSTENQNAAAAFFAKKKKKRPFKFNANLIDINTLSATTHVDAPALSTDEPKNVINPDAAGTSPDPAESQDWDESTRKATIQIPAAVPTAADMKSLQTGRAGAAPNIAEKLRIEETKKQLAAARQGMEREAQKAAEAKAEAEAKAAEAKAAARSQTGGLGGRWMGARMRSMQASRLPGATQKLDTTSAELFPDLQAADKILEEQTKTQTVVRVPKKTPVGGGASWASKSKTTTKKTLTSASASAPAPKNSVTPSVDSEPAKPADAKKMEAALDAPSEGSSAAASAPASSSASPPDSTPPPTAPAPVVPPIKPRRTGTKKPKKDLSTFKPGGAS